MNLARPIDDLGPADTLTRAAAALEARRSAVVEDLELVLRWADLHGEDPQERPGAVPARFGGDRLVDLGGDGTPQVQDLCLGELAIARQASALSTRSTMADALDLRHRLPRTWLRMRSLECEAWVACKVARASRELDRHQVALVDEAVAAAIGTQSPGRVLTLAQAKVIEADTDAHAAKVEAERRRRMVMLTATDEAGLRTLIARLEAADAVWVDATLDLVADLLASDADLRHRHHPDLPENAEGVLEVTKDELRAVALGWLARPHDLAALLSGLEESRKGDDAEGDRPEGDGTEGDRTEGDRTEARSARTPRLRQSAVVYVHLSQAALDGTPAVARVEGIGPMLLDQLARLLGHAEVTLRPVIDLAEQTSVTAYEHPTTVRERITLRHPGDAFPHASAVSRNVDLDHCVPYDPGGPPGQTGDHNTTPLGRRSHRTKTHLGYDVTQTGLTSHLWRTPHGLRRAVDHHGTREVDDLEAWHLAHPGALDHALDRIEAALRN